VPCGLRDPQPLQGLNEEQRELLKPRDRNKSEEERWKTVYKICFPRDRIIPRPCKSNSFMPVKHLRIVLTLYSDYVHYSQEIALLRQQVLQIVEEETMFVDGMIRERLLRRLQSAFESNTQSPGTTNSPVWSSVLDLPGRDSTYTLSTALPINNPPPWSEWETRHTNPEDIGRNNVLQQGPIPMDGDTRFAGPSLESPFFDPDNLDFEYSYETVEGNHMTGSDDTE
jgi:hypothetical protein